MVTSGLIVPSFLVLFVISNLSGKQLFDNNEQAIFGVIALLSTVFCTYRNSRKVLREARLQRLKNYLEDFIEDSKQEQNLKIERDEVVMLESPAQVELELTT